MQVTGTKNLTKLKNKNKGNKPLCDEIDKLLNDLKNYIPGSSRLTDLRKDADCVHNDGFYFFNIHVHRSLVLINFDEEGQATIIWAGSHDNYERIFKNNKPTIEKWLRKKGYII